MNDFFLSHQRARDNFYLTYKWGMAEEWLTLITTIAAPLPLLPESIIGTHTHTTSEKWRPRKKYQGEEDRNKERMRRSNENK